ncbi:MAG TPA: diaminopimelate epimerase, partial [Alphaproteobacteria bacterium]|nr:diaminopimelate epimerase [Alphaproteobacteria bacterium]
ENHKFFPERVNVNFAQIITKNKIRLRVWERGAGETLACGTGACATVAASFKKGLTDSNVQVLLDGGSLDVQFLNDGHLVMIGDVSRVFDGTIDKAIFKSKN